jgi:hypothetical protein
MLATPRGDQATLFGYAEILWSAAQFRCAEWTRKRTRQRARIRVRPQMLELVSQFRARHQGASLMRIPATPVKKTDQ